MSYYIYVYIDPRNGEPFYVGVGHGNRAQKHLRQCYRETSRVYTTHFHRKNGRRA